MLAAEQDRVCFPALLAISSKSFENGEQERLRTRLGSSEAVVFEPGPNIGIGFRQVPGILRGRGVNQ